MGQELGRRPSCGRGAQRRGHRVWRRAVDDIPTSVERIITIAMNNIFQACRMCQALYRLYFMIFTITPGCRSSPCAHFTENGGSRKLKGCLRSHVVKWKSLFFFTPHAQM